MKWITREREGASFLRQLNLGQGVDTEHISANYSNGVLSVTIPVSEKAKPRKIEVGVDAESPVVQARVEKAAPGAQGSRAVTSRQHVSRRTAERPSRAERAPATSSSRCARAVPMAMREPPDCDGQSRPRAPRLARCADPGEPAERLADRDRDQQQRDGDGQPSASSSGEKTASTTSAAMPEQLRSRPAVLEDVPEQHGADEEQERPAERDDASRRSRAACGWPSASLSPTLISTMPRDDREVDPGVGGARETPGSSAASIASEPMRSPWSK